MKKVVFLLLIWEKLVSSLLLSPLMGFGWVKEAVGAQKHNGQREIGPASQPKRFNNNLSAFRFHYTDGWWSVEVVRHNNGNKLVHVLESGGMDYYQGWEGKSPFCVVVHYEISLGAPSFLQI